jgi:DNA-binding winged helix-turn-helix (wHTH) protein
VRFVFDDYELDVPTRQLLRAGAPLSLTPKAFQLLQTLLERRPVVVSKDEIFTVLWPETHVAEANIPNLVAEIRSVLGDSARKPRYIRTAFRAGYAFAGEVSELSGGVPRKRETRLMCSLVAEGRTIPLHDGKHIVGRGSSCDLQLTNATVSRRHAAINVCGTSAVIEDLHSRNGTFVRGRRVKSALELKDSDRIHIGDVLVVFRLFSPMSTTHRIGVTGLTPRLRKILRRS